MKKSLLILIACLFALFVFEHYADLQDSKIINYGAYNDLQAQNKVNN